MNKFQDLLDDYPKPPYSLEDSINDAIKNCCDESYCLLNKAFQDCFIEFTNQRNIVIEELKKMLNDNGLDEDTIAKIVYKIDYIISTHFDYDCDEDDYY